MYSQYFPPDWCDSCSKVITSPTKSCSSASFSLKTFERASVAAPVVADMKRDSGTCEDEHSESCPHSCFTATIMLLVVIIIIIIAMKHAETMALTTGGHRILIPFQPKLSSSKSSQSSLSSSSSPSSSSSSLPSSYRQENTRYCAPPTHFSPPLLSSSISL